MPRKFQPPPRQANAALLLHPRIGSDPECQSRRAEHCALAHSAGYAVAAILTASLRQPHPRTFIGKGKLAELQRLIAKLQPQAVLIDHTLSDGQYAWLAGELHCQLRDYSGLILEIFAARATTADGKLQVELAQEMYGRSKLRGAWQHLERQRGALGAAGGPGERQLELDRRQLSVKINRLRRKIDKLVEHTKRTSARRHSHTPTIALVGYTNAGKSTLFARLTRAKARASAQVFETLTTTSRRAYLGDGHSAVISDTVGFIRNLPHELVAAFRSTLHEATVADLIAVVADGSDRECAAKLRAVGQTLDAIGAQTAPRLLIYNKADLGMPELLGGWCGKIKPVSISARSGSGISTLRFRLSEYLFAHRTTSLSAPLGLR